MKKIVTLVLAILVLGVVLFNLTGCIGCAVVGKGMQEYKEQQSILDATKMKEEELNAKEYLEDYDD